MGESLSFNIFAYPSDEPTFRFEPLLSHPDNPGWGELCELGQRSLDALIEGNKGVDYDSLKWLVSGFRCGFVSGARETLMRSVDAGGLW